jgi:hypothetical protein
LTKSSSTWPGTSVFEIAQFGVPLDKIVIGKPASSADASNGYMSPGQLAQCVQQAKAKNWSEYPSLDPIQTSKLIHLSLFVDGGVMAWQSPTADSAWIGTVRGQAF